MLPAHVALALTAALLAAPVAADEGDVTFRLALHGRFVHFANQPEPTLLFDRAARAFDLSRYLKPEGVDDYLSTYAAAAAEGRHGWFRWGLALDTGQLRSQSFPQLTTVCASATSPTGVDVSGGGRCLGVALGRRLSFAVEDTRLSAPQITSNGRSLSDELAATLFIREAWVGAALGRNDVALVRVGRKRFVVGDGFVYDDYGTGIEASFDLGVIGPSWDLGAALFYPTRDFPHAAGGWISPMLVLRADWLPSLFEHAGVFLALYRDQTGSVAELFRGSLAEPSVLQLRQLAPGTAAFRDEERALVATLGSARQGDARLGWLGTSGNLALGRGTRLDWTGALCLGSITIGLPDASIERTSSVSGQLAFVRLRASAPGELELGASFLFLSGDLPPTEKARLGLPKQYGGFLGIAPFVTLTNIFFNGGVAETFAARQATAPGVNGRGVLAPGLTLSWDPLRSLGIDLRSAYLFSDEEGPFGGRVYGPEVDLEVSWSPLTWLRFAAEADVLVPGNFFAGSAPVSKVVLGVDVVRL